MKYIRLLEQVPQLTQRLFLQPSLVKSMVECAEKRAVNDFLVSVTHVRPCELQFVRLNVPVDLLVQFEQFDAQLLIRDSGQCLGKRLLCGLLLLFFEVLLELCCFKLSFGWLCRI